MTKNVTVAWELPTTRQAGAPLPISEIDHTLVELSADVGANFIDLAQVQPTDPQQVFVPDTEVGEWHYRISVIDTNGKQGVPHIEVVTVVDDSPPNSVVNVTVTQE